MSPATVRRSPRRSTTPHSISATASERSSAGSPSSLVSATPRPVGLGWLCAYPVWVSRSRAYCSSAGGRSGGRGALRIPAVFLADALEVRLRRLLGDAQLEGDGLHRLATAVERHDPALLRAQLRRTAHGARVQREVEFCGDVGLAPGRRADRLDDHVGILALDE